jgi:2-succinyl-5-enolpyruvyl-6-hydroxy-3-cyclohexene-1-carboxylate synthase
MIYPKIPLAQHLIQICLAKGLTQIIISPGSRNAPLTIGFSTHSNFDCYSIADERCAAFFALGIAQQTKKPVALVCTSGSALLNYYPAFAEAFYSQIPLIVISADRPINKIDIGDGQTIRQQNVFANHSLFNANLTEVASIENDFLINKAIDVAVFEKGPTHINTPFEEPLYETVSELTSIAKITKNEFDFSDTIENIDYFKDIWQNAAKKMLLVGVNDPNSIANDNLEKIANDPSVTVFTETTSNLHHETFINNIDTIITPFSETEFSFFAPNLLITFGGMIVSKRIKAFLRKYKPKHHWHIDTHRAYDTFDALTHHFKMNPDDFFNIFLNFDSRVESDYFEKMNQIKMIRLQKTNQYLQKIPFSDFKAFQQIIKSLPLGCQFQISNSSAIRYAQLIDIDPSISVFCNRGTSGIDGSTSTAIGAAVASDRPTVFVTGDIGFLYDSNSLWNNYVPKNFKLILINNGGGGIFRILPGHEETPVFNQFFETSHCFTAQHLCKMFGLEYLIASCQNSLENSLESMYNQNEQPVLLEVFTPTVENDKILLQFFRELT